MKGEIRFRHYWILSWKKRLNDVGGNIFVENKAVSKKSFEPDLHSYRGKQEKSTHTAFACFIFIDFSNTWDFVYVRM